MYVFMYVFTSLNYKFFFRYCLKEYFFSWLILIVKTMANPSVFNPGNFVTFPKGLYKLYLFFWCISITSILQRINIYYDKGNDTSQVLPKTEQVF